MKPIRTALPLLALSLAGLITARAQDPLPSWNGKVYGIPHEQVVGSSIMTQYEMRDGRPVLMRLPAIDFTNDKVGKPVGINSHIGRRPIP